MSGSNSKTYIEIFKSVTISYAVTADVSTMIAYNDA